MNNKSKTTIVEEYFSILEEVNYTTPYSSLLQIKREFHY